MPPDATANLETLPFHWSYIILPAAIFLLSVILAAYFYLRLPQEVAYHFKFDGSPDRWLGRGTIIVWMLAPQLILTLLAGAVTLGIARLGILSQKTDVKGIKPGRILALMGNMIALPQLILCFAILDIFSYNSYGIHLMPLWVFGLIVMGLGGVILGLFFISAIRRVQRAA